MAQQGSTTLATDKRGQEERAEAPDNQADSAEIESLPSQAASIQVLLAEKRTYLAVMRTAIAIAVLPLSVTTVLVTLSRNYSWLDNLHFLIPMYTVLTGLTVLSIYLMIHSLIKIQRYDRTIEKIRRSSPVLREIV